jgi:riboflavin kinase/FMN adenylyltransferase
MDIHYTPGLLTTFDEKTELLAGLEIDYCLTLHFTTDVADMSAQEFMARVLKERFGVKCLLIGYDHRFGHNRSEGFDDYVRYGQALGIEVLCAKAFSEPLASEANVTVSSSVIRELLLKGDVVTAARALESPYLLVGTVVDGYQVGRTIGYPTANIHVNNPDKLIPGNGVYAVWVQMDGQTYMGMLSIGVRPTFGENLNRTIEVNILHFQGDVYGKEIRLIFVQRTRSEKKYDSLDALVAQLHKDAEETESILRADNSLK